MKKLSTLVLFLSAIALNAQVIQNPGFEEWETLPNGNPEPVNWSSSQSAAPEALGNLAPQVLFQDDTNPHSGEYCVRLQSVFVSIANIVSNGIATNGRVFADFNPLLADTRTVASDPKWNTACTTRPDSIVGWFRCAPLEDDFPIVQVVLHTGDQGAIPDDNSPETVARAKFEGPNETITEWTRFSTPFVYENDEDPDFILINLTSGNATNSVPGSQAWFDDIELVYNVVGLDENVANELLNVYSNDENIVIDMRKFGAGDKFELEVYTVTGQLVLTDQIVSGYTKEVNIETGGVYICTLKGANGLTLSKKVFVQ